MKSLILVILLLIPIEKSVAQNFIEYQNKLRSSAKRKIRKELIRSFTHDDWMSRLEAYSLLKKSDIVPVVSFCITSEAKKYDSTKRIIDYLQPNENFPFELAIFSKKRKFYATLDCFNTIYYSDCQPCNYDDSMEEKVGYHNYEIKKIYDAIKNRKYSLLFKVKYFREAIWLIENKEVKIYSLQDKLIYDPDEYIKKRCSVEVIRNLALGKLHSFCD
ncbi:MAG: hypothetical protein J7619_16050 [Dyadobacter sp.]|uniref:hypothetical protein n=1 Tax=Dyadobacter sp. TaxID=1914288 RepID=UPI001B25A2E6|nr:hypothetical protein [Dyadobacter sp.]MBO9614218.1 hypothetical protein [Dyadobacter sp.]